MRLLCSIIVVLVMVIIIRVRGHVYLTGSRCPNAPPMEDFDMQKFLGVWYAIEKSRSFFECLTYNISQPDPDRNPDDYRLQQTSVMMRSLISYTGRLRAPSRNATRRTGHMTVQFPLNMVGRSSFQVFSTDYTSYAAIYTCQPLMFLHRHSVTLLSRTKELDERVLRDLRYRMYDSNIQSLDLRRIEQEDCAAAREPQRTSEVKLAGWAKYHSSSLFPAEDEENTAAEVSDISQEKEGKIDRKETFVETVGSQDDSHETDNDYIDIIERHRKTRWF